MKTNRIRKSKNGCITLKDKFVLSPIEKFIYYDKFPFKLIVHLLLIIFTTIQVLDLVDSSGAAHAREQKRVFKSLLLNSTDEEDTILLLTPYDFQAHLQGVVYAFQNLNMYLFQEGNTNPTEYNLDCYYQDAFINNNNNTSVNSQYPVDILNGIFQPFDINNIASIKAFMNTVIEVSFGATNIITSINQNEDSSVCAVWNVSLLYNFKSFTSITVQIISNEMSCGTPDASRSFSLYAFSYNNKLIHLAVLILSTTSIILSMKHIYSVGTLYMKAKHAYKKMLKLQKQMRKRSKADYEQQRKDLIDGVGMSSQDFNIKKLMEKNVSWEELPMSDKLKFFNFWFISSILGNCFQIVGSFSILLSSASMTTFTDKTLTIDNIFIGFGCFFAWFQLFYYLEFNRDVVLITSVFKKSSMLNVVFFGLVLPVFMGYVFLGQALFWDYEFFNSTGSSANSLFALSCGDLVYESFIDTINEPYFKQIYLFAYLITFYTSIQNIFVAIVMEGYERTLIRKELDNDDPFPDLQKVRIETEASSSKSESEVSDTDIKSDGPDQGLRRIDSKVLPKKSQAVPNIIISSKTQFEDLNDTQGSIYNEYTPSYSELGSAFQKPSTLEQFNEEKTPKLECINKLKLMTRRIKEKLLDMKKLVDKINNSNWSEPYQEFIEDLYDQQLVDLCGRINFLSKGSL